MATAKASGQSADELTYWKNLAMEQQQRMAEIESQLGAALQQNVQSQALQSAPPATTKASGHKTGTAPPSSAPPPTSGRKTPRG